MIRLILPGFCCVINPYFYSAGCGAVNSINSARIILGYNKLRLRFISTPSAKTEGGKSKWRRPLPRQTPLSGGGMAIRIHRGAWRENSHFSSCL